MQPGACAILRLFVPRRRYGLILLLLLLLFTILFFFALFVVAQAGVMVFLHSLPFMGWSQMELENLIPEDTQGKLSLKTFRRSETGFHLSAHPSLSHTNGTLRLSPSAVPRQYQVSPRNGRVPFSRDVQLQANLTHPSNSCQIHREDRVLFFIRVPKCASTSFVELLYRLSIKTSKFAFLFHPSGAYNWNTATKMKVAEQCKWYLSNNKGVVYARHFYFVDFRMYGLTNYTFIAVIREPISRFVSSYLYYHFSSKIHIQNMLDSSHARESLLTCLEHEHDGCTTNLLTKYFCGHQPFCKLGNEAALRVAKHNLQMQFAAVGVSEEMELSLRVFQTVLPTFFETLGSQGLKLRTLNQNERSLNITSEERDAIATANSADLALYRYAVEVLHSRAKDCGLEIG